MDAEQMARQMQERIPISAKDALDEFTRLCAQAAEFEGHGTSTGTSTGEVRTRFAALLDKTGYNAEMERYNARPRLIRWLTSGRRRKLEALRRQCFMSAVFEVVEAMAERCYCGCEEVEPGVYEHSFDFAGVGGPVPFGESPLKAEREG